MMALDFEVKFDFVHWLVVLIITRVTATLLELPWFTIVLVDLLPITITHYKFFYWIARLGIVLLLIV